MLCIAGLMTLFGRCSHAYAIALDGTSHNWRFRGMVATLASMMFMLATLLGHAAHLW
jgi:uncharacterized membrane protein YecN with MAPEG domain